MGSFIDISAIHFARKESASAYPERLGAKSLLNDTTSEIRQRAIKFKSQGNWITV